MDDLYRSHAAEVYRYAFAMLGNRADAEDVTQTTFVNALRSLERGERPRKPSNWLVTIAHNIVRQRWRQQQARPAEVELDRDVALEEHEQEGPSLDDLVQALQRIPHAQREALVMRELEGRSYKEIEAILQTTPSALETLLFRARRSLAEELENIVTCERAELSISKRLDGRLSRKDKRRLDEHLRECPQCERLYAGRTKHRRAFGALSLLPLPFSFTFFRDAPSATAGTGSGLTTIGAGGVTAGGITAAAGVTVATCGSSCVTGGLLAGGFAAKAVAVVAAASVAGSVGYEGARHIRESSNTKTPVAAVAQPSHPRPSVAAVAAAGTSEAADRSNDGAAGVLPPSASAPYALAAPTARAPQKPEVAAGETEWVWEIEDAGTAADTSGPPPVLAPPQAPVPPAPVHAAAPAQTGGTTTNATPTTTEGSSGGTDTAAPVTDTAPVETPPTQDTIPAPETPATDTTPADPAAGDPAAPADDPPAPVDDPPAPADTTPAAAPDTPPTGDTGSSGTAADTSTTPPDPAPAPDPAPLVDSDPGAVAPVN